MLLAISPFLTMFSTAIYLNWVKMWYCVVMGYRIFFLGLGEDTRHPLKGKKCTT